MIAVLRAHRLTRAAMALQLGRDDALVFGDHEGGYLHPERTSGTFKEIQGRCRRDLGGTAPSEIRLHESSLRAQAAETSVRYGRDGSPARRQAPRSCHGRRLVQQLRPPRLGHDQDRHRWMAAQADSH